MPTIRLLLLITGNLRIFSASMCRNALGAACSCRRRRRLALPKKLPASSGPNLQAPPSLRQLPGWAYRIRTGESVRELSDWNCGTTSPEIGASPAAETLRVGAALHRFSAAAKISADDATEASTIWSTIYATPSQKWGRIVPLTGQAARWGQKAAYKRPAGSPASLNQRHMNHSALIGGL
jgi:hypothetical protein